jgi:transcription-repair coupling factor (superfamily II helicase)
MPLHALPSLLRSEPGLTHAFGDPQALIAVSEAARPVAIAALSQLGGRRPLVVACPTGSDAGQLFDDLSQFLPDGDVVLFPAWETLPFERVSPSVETMGRRLEVLWRLRTPDRSPAIVVTGVRALLQRLGPGATSTEPVVVRPGDILDADELLRSLIGFGYRREELV